MATAYGGGGPCHDMYGLGCGTVFRLTPAQTEWQEQVLYRFQGGNDGQAPRANLLLDAKGNLFGTTSGGGNQECSGGCGTVFELSRSGGKVVESVAYRFGDQRDDGIYPSSNLISDKAGNLYGTGYAGGSGASGTIFELSSNGTGGWNETVLYAFSYYGVGGFPVPGVLMDGNGDLFGTALGGGAVCPQGYCGTVFEIQHSQGGYNGISLHDFSSENGDGYFPYAGLVSDGHGHLYGTAPNGGAFCGAGGCGAVYELTYAGGTWTYQVIYSFQGAPSDGSFPEDGALILDKGGNLYGTTGSGGTSNYGTVFKLSPMAGGGWQETVLHSFQGGADGSSPDGGVVFDGAGNLYGTTLVGGSGKCSEGCGVVFEITP